MMKNQRELQLALGGSDPQHRSKDALMDYLVEMSFALTDEVHEAMAEVQWKTWSKRRGEINRDAFVAELVDALQFWMNMMAAVGATAEEIDAKLKAKHHVNWQRLREGTNGLNKCHRCKRALDDPAVKCTTEWCAAL